LTFYGNPLLDLGVFATEPSPFGAMGVIPLMLAPLGSYLNTKSNLQHWKWKKKPSPRGYCYTEGLFGHSMLIIYFGDTVFFIGWVILAATIFASCIAIFVTAGLVIFLIPALDTYLSKRYGAEFDEYSKRAAKFVPVLY